MPASAGMTKKGVDGFYTNVVASQSKKISVAAC
jgi:hypothetical protein